MTPTHKRNSGPSWRRLLTMAVAAILSLGTVQSQERATRSITVEEYRAIETKLKAAIDSGRISAEDAQKRLAGARKHITAKGKKPGDSKKRGEGANTDKQVAVMKRLGKQLQAAVKVGLVTKDEMKKMLLKARERAAKAHGQDGRQPDRASGDGASGEKRIRAAIKSGRVSKQDGERRLKAMREGQRSKANTARAAQWAKEAKTKVREAVRRGEISRKQAGERVEAIDKRVAMRSDQGKTKRDERTLTVEEYRGVEKRVKTAIKAGQISAEDGKKRLTGARKMVKGKQAARAKGGEVEKLAGVLKGLGVQLQAACKAGLITETEVKEMIGNARERIGKRARKTKAGSKPARTKNGKSRKSISVDDYKSIVERIKKAVDAGRLTEEEAEKKMIEARGLVRRDR